MTEAQQRSVPALFRRRFPWLLATLAGGLLAAVISDLYYDVASLAARGPLHPARPGAGRQRHRPVRQPRPPDASRPNAHLVGAAPQGPVRAGDRLPPRGGLRVDRRDGRPLLEGRSDRGVEPAREHRGQRGLRRRARPRHALPALDAPAQPASRRGADRARLGGRGGAAGVLQPRPLVARLKSNDPFYLPNGLR